MELYEEIMAKLMVETLMRYLEENEWLTMPQLIEGECYQALQKIRDIIRNEDLDDRECFNRIEGIVSTLESIGSHGGIRHDFG